MAKDINNPTFQETVEWLRENPEFQKAILSYFESGRDGALAQVLKEHGSEYSDSKRNIIAALYSELLDHFS